MKRTVIRSDLRNKRRNRLIFATLLLVLSLPFSFFFHTFGNFYTHLNRFNLAAENQESDLAERELAALDYYYNLATVWGMRGLADRYFYDETYLRKAVLDYMIGDYEKVVKSSELFKNNDYHLVAQLIGSAKFRLAKARYMDAKTKQEKSKIIKEATEDCDDFRKAAENGPGSAEYFDHSFNFDLCIDPDAVQMAFESPGRQRVRLGYKGPKSGDKPSDQNGNRIDPSKPGGPSGSKKVG